MPRLRELKQESARLKRMCAKLSLAHELLSGVAKKVWSAPWMQDPWSMTKRQMYPASRESAAFVDQTMLGLARGGPNKWFGQ